jgi:hypothetical protein
MAKMKADDLIYVHNNMARARGVAGIPIGMELTLHEVADKIERMNKVPFRNKNKPSGKPTKKIGKRTLLTSMPADRKTRWKYLIFGIIPPVQETVDSPTPRM